MADAGDLIRTADYAFAFRTIEPRPESPRALLVLLHGVGSDELQLVPLADAAPEGTLVVMPRGHRSISGGRLGWYRIGMSEDGVQVVEDEEREARARLVDFLGQLQSRFDVPPARTVVGGFSQGGILAASTALTSPALLSAFFMVSGRLIPGLEAELAPPDALRQLQGLIVHGRADDTLPEADAHQADAWLRRLGVEHRLHLHQAGHVPETAMLEDVRAWLAARPEFA